MDYRDPRKIANDTLQGSALYDFLYSAFAAAHDSLAPGAPFYVFGPGGPNLEQFFASLRAAGLPAHEMLLWVKPSLVLGRSDYHHQHEVVLTSIPETPADGPDPGETFDAVAYGWKPGAPHLWCSDRKQTTVLRFDKPRRAALHPTMKPVEMLAYLLCNSTLPGAVVLDPFGGSGSTMIACEQTGRRCAMMELDPRYCDVIIRRWEAFTGRKAVLLNE